MSPDFSEDSFGFSLGSTSKGSDANILKNSHPKIFFQKITMFEKKEKTCKEAENALLCLVKFLH